MVPLSSKNRVGLYGTTKRIRRRSSIASKSPVNLPANWVRRGVRGDAGGGGSGWGAWGHARGAASVVRAVAAIRLRRDIVICVSSLVHRFSSLGSIAGGARPAERGRRAGQLLYALKLHQFNPRLGSEESQVSDRILVALRNLRIGPEPAVTATSWTA